MTTCQSNRVISQINSTNLAFLTLKKVVLSKRITLILVNLKHTLILLKTVLNIHSKALQNILQ